MATVTGLTAERMLAIEAASVVDGEILADHLILTKHDGTQIDAGSVVGPPGPTGPSGSNSVSVLNAASVLEPGIPNQIRAGRVLTVADFTTLLGLSTPIGLFNLGSVANLGSGGALSNKGTVPFGKGISGAAVEAAVFAGSTSQALYSSDTGAADPFRIPYGSIGCWFKIGKLGTVQYMLSKVNSAASVLCYGLQVNASNILVGLIGNGAGAWIVNIQGSRNVADNKWHFAVMTYDGSYACLYLDGTLEATTTPTTPGPIGAGAAPFNIGGYGADGATAAVNPTNGRIDEAFITQDVLNEFQVRQLYAAKLTHGATFTPTSVDVMIRRLRKGAAFIGANFPAVPLHLYNFSGGSLADAGSLNNLLTNNGAAIVSPGADGLQGNAFNLNGTSQYLSTTDAGLPSGVATRTVGCWFKIGPPPVATSWLMSYGTIGGYFSIYMYNTGGLNCGDGNINAGSVSSYADGQWHFATAVYEDTATDGVRLKFYIDGKLVGMSISSLTNPTVLGGAGAFRLGSLINGTGFFGGQLDGVFVTNTALSAEDIATLYAVGSLSLGTSPKNEGDHVERVDSTNVYLICDTLESQYQMDLLVSS